jgi:hypothetical protein
MDHIGIDVHTKESRICLLADGGDLIEQQIRTAPERFAAESSLARACPPSRTAAAIPRHTLGLLARHGASFPAPLATPVLRHPGPFR